MGGGGGTGPGVKAPNGAPHFVQYCDPVSFEPPQFVQ
jgi:hypothetical protein